MSLLNDRLKRLDAKHGKTAKSIPKRLKVYYGWRKLGKVIRKEALTVIFINDTTGPRIGKDGMDGVTRYIDVVHSRWQTEQEMADAEGATRIYSVYEIRMDDKRVQGSLKLALDENDRADRNIISQEERAVIREKLREAYIAAHMGYKEPNGIQLQIDF